MERGYAELILDWLLRGTTLTPPSTWYLVLDVSLTGAAYTEPAYIGYSRSALPRASGAWVTAVGNGQIVSAADVTWPAVPGGYTAGEQVRRVLIIDQASTAGEHVLFVVDLADVVTLIPGGVPTFTAGTLVINA